MQKLNKSLIYIAVAVLLVGDKASSLNSHAEVPLPQIVTEHQISPEQLIGTWYFQSGKYTERNGKFHSQDNNGFTAIKTFSNNKFAVVNMKNGQFTGFLEGDYFIDHTNKLVEKPKKGGENSEHVGRAFEFSVRISPSPRGDMMYHKGEENGIYIEEVWLRLN